MCPRTARFRRRSASPVAESFPLRCWWKHLVRLSWLWPIHISDPESPIKNLMMEPRNRTLTWDLNGNVSKIECALHSGYITKVNHHPHARTPDMSSSFCDLSTGWAQRLSREMGSGGCQLQAQRLGVHPLWDVLDGSPGEGRCENRRGTTGGEPRAGE